MVVPDSSVVVAALFQEDLSRPARRLFDSIERQEVAAWAPNHLICEFLSAAFQKQHSRGHLPHMPRYDVQERIALFFESAIRYIAETHLRELAWELMLDAGVSPPDSWMLACAIHMDAEIWISHDHADGFVKAAKGRYEKVFTLQEHQHLLP